jgi:hypothetical protein
MLTVALVSELGCICWSFSLFIPFDIMISHLLYIIMTFSLDEQIVLYFICFVGLFMWFPWSLQSDIPHEIITLEQFSLWVVNHLKYKRFQVALLEGITTIVLQVIHRTRDSKEMRIYGETVLFLFVKIHVPRVPILIPVLGFSAYQVCHSFQESKWK